MYLATGCSAVHFSRSEGVAGGSSDDPPATLFDPIIGHDHHVVHLFFYPAPQPTQFEFRSTEIRRSFYHKNYGIYWFIPFLLLSSVKTTSHWRRPIVIYDLSWSSKQLLYICINMYVIYNITMKTLSTDHLCFQFWVWRGVCLFRF